VIRCPNCGQQNPDGFRFCGACGAELVAAPAPREVRKTVTVVFCDVTGSTAMGERLDPESTRRVMARYFDSMREAIERHGGTVEKFIGDAVMAVFGVPVVHEDDALRAVRAAADMRQDLAELNDELERDWGVRIESRIGVNTGEVVTGEGDSIATGDAVNVAARLEQAATVGETLLGESTYRLVRDAVTAEPAPPIDAKGKAQPLIAYRLTGLVEGAEFILRRLDSPLVGRENELAQLQRAFDHAVSERVAYQFTLLGPAGIGKSRLVRELLDRVDARLLGGRCLPYGEGITYWPLVEIEQLGSEIDFEANRDEIALQTRRILERLAREQPLVVVFDDLQWAEPTFLDLIDHVTDLARDASMLLVCIARPELLDQRPGWGGGKLNATTMLLEALSPAESAQLVDNLLLAQLQAGMKERIAAAAEGNPLFLEEMLAMVAENGKGALAVPPTIQALLAARLDRLRPEERTAVECAAVQGQEFRQDALATLVPETLAGRLSEIHQSLVRKDLVRPTGDDTFRFKHLLLRDAAYEGLPKEQRADLHERFAGWVETAASELEEIRGYHLEQAYRYRAELGPVDEKAKQLARRASRLLAAAGQRAWSRADVSATINLLERAVVLLPDGDADAVALYPDLGAAIAESGDFDRPVELFRVAAERGDAATALRGRVRQAMHEVMRGGAMADAVAPLEAVIREAEEAGNERVLAEAFGRLGVITGWLGEPVEAESLLRRSLQYAESVGDARAMTEAAHWIALIMMWGPTPVEQALRECERLRRSIGDERFVRTELRVAEGLLLAMTGEFDRARQLATDGRAALLELGHTVQWAAIVQPAAFIELFAGEYERAEQLLREARQVLADVGERGYLSTVSAVLARALVMQGRYEEAEVFADEARELGAEDDRTTQLYWRAAKAPILAARGERDEAARLAAEVVALAPPRDDLDSPDTLLAVADFLEPAAKRAALEQALAGSLAKGNRISVAEARARLEALP
jgi:class 3 adenylate cyclase/tetratricopeptide (TPR) repeat protein